MNTHPAVRAAVAALALTLMSAGSPAVAQAGASSSPHYRAKGTAAARWQATQLHKRRIHTSGFDDWGLTIDSAFAIAADGTQPRLLRHLTRAIENNYYDHYATFKGDVFAGAMAKSLVAAKILGRRARHFGGHNVRHRVLSLVAPARAGFEAGRLRDTGATDFTNTISQAYGVLGLARTGGVRHSAVTYLLKQQCAQGYFRTFETVGETCDRSSSRADVDATAIAIQALVAARRSGARVTRAAIPDAARWLLSKQRASGGFGGGPATRAVNTNSTGLAVQALVATHHSGVRSRAARYVASQQITRARADRGRARRDIGAIAYNAAGLAAALRDGVTSTTRDQFRRSTAQAIYALVPRPLSTLSVR